MIACAQKSAIGISREDIKLTDRDLIKRYMNIDTFPCKIESPLREDDYTPSFSMMQRGDTVFWKDWGTGESGNAVSLFARLWHVTYNEALLKISMDTNNRIPKFSLVHRIRGKVHLISGSTIEVRVRKWKDWDVEFWESFGIPEKFATWCNVYPISHAFFTKEIDGRKRTVTVPMDKYAYAYFEWKDGKQSIKLYQPYSETMKWLSKHDASVWDLWKQAMTFARCISSNNLIITSSRKDAMCLWYNLGIPAISMQGEGYLPKEQVMQELLSTFKTVYLWYDNDFKHKDDNPGQDNAKKLIDLYPSLKNICIPSELQCKDPSDLVKTLGVNQLKQVWKQQR